MKCDIIRDLLPSYIDGLTSQTSNIEIESHIKDCAECQGILKNMQKEMEPQEIEENKRDIKPLKKLSKKVRRAVAITAAGFIVAAGLCFYLCFWGWGVSSDDLKISHWYNAEQGGSIETEFELTNGRTLHSSFDRAQLIGQALKFRQSFGFPLDDRGEAPNQCTIGYGVEHLEKENGKLVFNEDETLVIKLKDKTITLKYEDIAKQLGV